MCEPSGKDNKMHRDILHFKEESRKLWQTSGVSVAPQKGLMSSKKFLKKKLGENFFNFRNKMLDFFKNLHNYNKPEWNGEMLAIFNLTPQFLFTILSRLVRFYLRNKKCFRLLSGVFCPKWHYQMSRVCYETLLRLKRTLKPSPADPEYKRLYPASYPICTSGDKQDNPFNFVSIAAINFGKWTWYPLHGELSIDCWKTPDFLHLISFSVIYKDKISYSYWSGSICYHLTFIFSFQK